MDAHDFTHFMFIDADIEFSAQSIIRMLAKDKDVLCGLYSKKSINMEKLVNLARTRPDLTREFCELPFLFLVIILIVCSRRGEEKDKTRI
jgi:hypothetical protein